MIINIILKKKNIQIIKFIYLMKKAANFHSEIEDNSENLGNNREGKNSCY